MANIFNVLRSIGEVEQTGGDYPQVVGDIVFLAPVVMFRHKHRTQELADLLTKWIGEFPGELRWHLGYKLSGPGINWVLAPQRLWDVAEQRKLASLKTASQQLLREDPEFGRKARVELDMLADHLASCWQEHLAHRLP